MLTFNNIQISSLQSTRDEAFVKLNVRLSSRPGIHKLVLKVDTGAQGNTIPLRIYSQMFADQLTKDGLPAKNVAKAAHKVRLTAYYGTNIPCYGIIDVPCEFKDSGWENTKFHIVDVPGPAIIGLPSCESLKVVTMHCSINHSIVSKYFGEAVDSSFPRDEHFLPMGMSRRELAKSVLWLF